MNKRLNRVSDLAPIFIVELNPCVGADRVKQSCWFPWHDDDRQFFKKHHRKMRLRQAFPGEFSIATNLPGAIQMVICQRVRGAVLKSAFKFFGDLENLLNHCSQSDERVSNLRKQLERDGIALLTPDASVSPLGGQA